MKLLLFLVDEFLHMITAAFLIVILYFGGWHCWGLTSDATSVGWSEALIRVAVLMTKIFLVIVFFMIVRWSWPRFRFDQLMALAWKVMLPLGLINLVAVAVLAELGHTGKIGTPLLVGIGWATMIGSWILAAVVAPLHDENRPQPAAQLFDSEREL